jgi:hypothetical protein
VNMMFFYQFSGSGETGMNRFGSLSNHENITLYEGLPPQSLSEARRAGSFLIFYSPIRRGGVPSGAAAIIVHKMETIPAFYLNTMIFMGNAQLPDKRSRGFHPRRYGSPKCDRPRTGNTSSSLSAGAVWGDRHCPLHNHASARYFISWQ